MTSGRGSGSTRSGQNPTGMRSWRCGYSFKTEEGQGGRAVAQPFRPVTDLQLQFCVHFFCFCRQAFPQKHGLAVGKAKQVGEHPKPGAESVLLADVAVDQQPDFF